ncbi:circadian clock KaiB family protein [Leptolyngbya sp. FACHB-261]|uniref:circadian clock KaiB family protein n=1 Tax=Leptolyngbya sp. FACHB-261 TaxID=2692806 RepID=UPI0016843488|nr:circadian clock KaiB family protein [Leptolyngbya sp. FACHB-261]MBD2104885.1 circadian clock protein KaiB [Leptolyngbya sp. FACHB-261]
MERSQALFKGIALFTPGGDFVYAVDPSKLSYWHLHLCSALQRALSLDEPPHFLTPCYTASVDCWQHPQTGQIHITAEAYPAVLRYQALLNAAFGLSEHQVWQLAPADLENCDPILIEAHQSSFPELWEDHDLVLKVERPEAVLPVKLEASRQERRGYEFRLFISGNNLATEQILQELHLSLERLLHEPYSLKIIDVLKHPEEAEADHINVTPTLLKAWPLPTRRLSGKLDNLARLLASTPLESSAP